MVFSSVLFLFRFLPIFIIIYFVAPRRMRNVILFLGSLLFYAWGEPIYVLLMLFSTVSDYVHGRAIGYFRKRPVAAGLLVSSIIINLGVLCFFKYADFLLTAVNTAFGTGIPLLNLPLPIGISFYTFQTMSYTIDVYRGKAEVQKNILDFGVFVTMFPQLIAGPIVKYTAVQEVIHDHHADITRINYGIRRFIIGLAKKVLIANNVGALWEQTAVLDFTGMPVAMAWLGAAAYGLQIYFDFSGYSDMAIGLGACLGFTFPENFRYPYIARSITEFWRRWHITLSDWFREYVYIPLGGNRRGLGIQLRNILIVWTLTGIWHGAGWNFLLWGLWFALFLIAEKLGLLRILEKLPGVAGHFYTLVIVLVSWVFFAVESAGGIRDYLGAMFGIHGAGYIDDRCWYWLSEHGVLLMTAAIAATPLFGAAGRKLKEAGSGCGLALYGVLEKLIPSLLLISSVAYVVAASYNPFLYFRF